MHSGSLFGAQTGLGTEGHRKGVEIVQGQSLRAGLRACSVHVGPDVSPPDSTDVCTALHG